MNTMASAVEAGDKLATNMTREETDALAARGSIGDPYARARALLVLAPLLLRAADDALGGVRSGNAEELREELFGFANVAAAEAIADYQRDKGAWTTWALSRVRQDLKAALRGLLSRAGVRVTKHGWTARRETVQRLCSGIRDVADCVEELAAPVEDDIPDEPDLRLPNFAALSRDEARAVTLRYGLDGAEPRSLDAAAKEMHRSPTWVRHVEAGALVKLRKAAAAEAA